MKSLKASIYDRYIFEQVLVATFAAILLFTVVWIAPEMLLNVIKKVLSGAYSIKTAVLLIAYELPKILGQTLPGGLLLGTLFTFDKLCKDSELVIFRAIGLSYKRIIVPVMVLAAFVTALCFITYDKMIPFAENKIAAIKGRQPATQYIYTQKDKNDVPTLAVVVSRYQNNQMQNVILLDFSQKTYTDVHQLSNIYHAKTGETMAGKWKLYDITHYKISSDGIFFDIDNLEQMDILEGEAADNAYTLMTYAVKRDREISNKDLKSYIKLLKKEGMDEQYRFMLHKHFQRFIQPLICILLAILGTLLGFSKPREQKLIGFTIAIGCIFVYYITLPFFDVLATKGILHPIITSTLPPLMFLGAIFAFYKSKDL